jgi:2-oxoisovalerate dehydrogenase E1 component alpha subunit
MLQILTESGRASAGAPTLAKSRLLEIYEQMLRTRLLDERMINLQRQGRIGFYVPSTGEEAAQIGCAVATGRKDWVYPSYRVPGLHLALGASVHDMVANCFGNDSDNCKGRQMPVHYAFAAQHMVSISSPIGTHIIQAAGTAYAQKLRKEKACTWAYFGDGGTSSNDFHSGMNFAGVWKAPCVFICRNNGWAISVPSSTQTAAKSFAAKAVGYGMPGIRVDGNDLLAVWQVASEAIERARAGEGPTLIEALTYRVQGHSSSDDPSVYRDPKEPEIWEKKDPLNRLRNYLKHRGMWTEAWEAELWERYNQEITDALAASDHKHAPAIETMFDDVYEEPATRSKNPHHHG